MSLINGLSAAGYAAGDYFAKSALADSAAKHTMDLTAYQAELQQQRDQRLEETRRAPLKRVAAVAQEQIAAGKTGDEAFGAALDQLKTSDPEAYLAGQSMVTPKTTTIPDGAAVIDTKTGKVIYKSEGKDARALEIEDRKDKRAEEDRKSAERIAAGRDSARQKPPADYRFNDDGGLEAIPGGPADLKKQGALNSDTAQLTGSLNSMDRLAVAANELLNHPGLKGITGWRGSVPNVPGSDAANAEALLGTLKSQVGFGVLQDMRNNSKTGGALGAVSDSENKMLQANLAALDKSQSFEQYQANLKKIVDYADGAKDRLREAFNLRHKSDGSDSKPATSGMLRVSSPEEARKLPPGTMFIDPNGVTRRRP